MADGHTVCGTGGQVWGDERCPVMAAAELQAGHDAQLLAAPMSKATG